MKEKRAWWIGTIYHLDNQLSDLEPDDRKKQRQITVKTLVEAFFAWVKKWGPPIVCPKGKHRKGSITVLILIRKKH